jgi:hypothetical protein
MSKKKDNLESIDREIARLQEQMSNKSHLSQVGGQDSTKGLQKLSELYAKRRALQS